MNIHAVILAGGLGSRLLPFTRTTPKHLLPIGDEPVIAHQLHRLAAAGVTSVVLATSYHADAFRPALGEGAAYGLSLRYAREESPLGTAGALRHAAREIDLAPDDVVVVLNGDLITEHDLRAQVKAHVGARGADTRAGARAGVTIHARHVDDASAFGLLHLDAAGRVRRFEEKPPGHAAGLVNAGTYVVDPSVIDLIPDGEVSSLERDLFPRLAASGQVGVHVEDAAFADIGTPAALLAANVAWAREHGASSVDLSGESGSNPAARVVDSLVMSGARLGACVIERSIIGPRARVGDGARVVDCVVGDDSVIAPSLHLVGQTLACGERRPEERRN